MTVTTIYPDDASGFTGVVGATSATTALSDGVATSYVQLDSGPVTLNFGRVPGVAQNVVVSAVSLVMDFRRVAQTMQDAYVVAQVEAPVLSVVRGQAGMAVAETTVAAGAAASTATWTRAVSLTGMTIGSLAGFTVRLWCEGPDVQWVGLAKAALEVTYSTATTPTTPTLAISGPSGVQDRNRQPLSVAWTLTGPGSAPAVQSAYQVRVFTAAQYGIGGFAAATSPCTWDSGVVASDRPSTAIGATLDTGTTWRAYVRATDGTWSSWGYTGFTFATAPVVTVANQTITDAFAEEVAWTVAGSDSGAMVNCARVKAFASAPSDPDADAHLYDSGVLYQQRPNHVICPTVPDDVLVDSATTKVLAVKVSDDGGLNWSAWDTGVLTISGTVPTMPAGAKTSVANNTTAAVALTMPATAAVYTAAWERSDDGGTTWVRVAATATSTSTASSLNDRFAPLGTTLQYRTFLYASGSTPTTASSSNPVLALGQSWVKHATDSALDVQADVTINGWQVSDTQPSALMWLAGRSTPIVAATENLGDKVSLSMLCTAWSQVEALEALRPGPVLVQRGDDGQQWWLRVSDRQVDLATPGSGRAWRVTWNAVEVEQP